MKKSFFLYMFLIGFFCSPGHLLAAEASRAKVLEIQGEARYLTHGQSEWQSLDNGVVLAEGDSVRTSRGSQVKFELTGEAKTAEIVIKEDSDFTFKTLQYEPSTHAENTLLDISLGGVLVNAQKLVGDSKFEVKTPTSVVGIRGTIFEVQVSKV